MNYNIAAGKFYKPAKTQLEEAVILVSERILEI